MKQGKETRKWLVTKRAEGVCVHPTAHTKTHVRSKTRKTPENSVPPDGIFALSLLTPAYQHAPAVDLKTAESTHLDTNLVSLLVSFLKDEVNHLSDLIGSHGAG
jgi:hypothetical protein